MDEKARRSMEERVRSNCGENRRHIDASRFLDKGQTDRPVKVTSRNFDKMMEQRGLTAEETKQLKSSFQQGTIEMRHGKKGEDFVVTHGEERASGVFVAKQSLGKTPEERIDHGALPASNKANYETRVVLDRDQTLISGKIAEQPDFVKQDPKHLARDGGGTQIVTDGGYASGAIRQEDPKYPVPVKSQSENRPNSGAEHKKSNSKGQTR